MEEISALFEKCSLENDIDCLNDLYKTYGLILMPGFLITIIKQCDVKIAEFYINHGYRMKGNEFEYGWIDYVVKNNRIDILNLLIEEGANINTILRRAAEYNNLKIASLVLELGVNPNKALEYACRHGNLEMVEFLMENGGDISHDALEFAAVSGNIELVQFLLDNAPPLNGKYNLVFFAALNNNYDMVKFLLDIGVSDQKTLGDLLHVNIGDEVSEEIIDIIELLLERGADPNEIYDDVSLLTLVISLGLIEYPTRDDIYIKIIQLLVDYGAEVTDELIELAPTDEIKDILLNPQGTLVKSSAKFK